MIKEYHTIKKEGGDLIIIGVLKKFEENNIYSFCKWMESFIESPANCNENTLALFSGLKSFRAHYLIKKSSQPISLKEAVEEKGRNATYSDDIIKHLTTIDPAELTSYDKLIYSGIIKVMCEKMILTDLSQDVTESLTKIVSSSLLEIAFEPIGLIDFLLGLIEKVNDEEENLKLKQVIATKLCVVIEKVPQETLIKEDMLYQRMLVAFLSGLMNENLSGVIVKYIKSVQNSPFFAGLTIENKDFKAALTENIMKSWSSNLNLFAQIWRNTWKTLGTQNENICELFLATLPRLKENYEFFLNDIMELFNTFLNLFLEISLNKKDNWIKQGIIEIVLTLPSFENEKLSQFQREKLFSILEKVYIFIISHKECYSTIPIFLSKHFKTQCMQFHLYLYLQYTAQAPRILNLILMLLKEKLKYQINYLFFLPFYLLYNQKIRMKGKQQLH